MNLVGFVREIEAALIEVCNEFGIASYNVSLDASGVWVVDDRGDRKIAAIGIRVAKGVTMHGFALNVNPDLSAFEQIIPCGIARCRCNLNGKGIRSVKLAIDEVATSCGTPYRLNTLAKVSA